MTKYAGIAAGSWDAYFDFKEALHFLQLFVGEKVLTWNSLKKNLHNC